MALTSRGQSLAVPIAISVTRLLRLPGPGRRVKLVAARWLGWFAHLQTRLRLQSLRSLSQRANLSGFSWLFAPSAQGESATCWQPSLMPEHQTVPGSGREISCAQVQCLATVMRQRRNCWAADSQKAGHRDAQSADVECRPAMRDQVGAGASPRLPACATRRSPDAAVLASAMWSRATARFRDAWPKLFGAQLRS